MIWGAIGYFVLLWLCMAFSEPKAPPKQRKQLEDWCLAHRPRPNGLGRDA